MGKVIMSGIVPQLTVPSAGTPISEFAVGSTVKMNVNGTQKDFLIVHQGLPSSMYDSSCDGTWLLMKDIYENRQWHSSNSNSYKASTIHSYLNSTFLGLFDSDIQAAIKEVKIPYVNGTGSGGSVASGSAGLNTKVFLLSGYEVGWTKSDSNYFPIDGSCLSYFNGMAVNDSMRIGYLNGTAAFWWLRSPNTGTTLSTWSVMDNGYYYDGAGSASEYGVRPALILPPTALVKDDGTVKGAA